tara:strand:+ start:55 stop:483 length:429 start_codon:yes stop_codon:yes gene_type:complete
MQTREEKNEYNRIYRKINKDKIAEKTREYRQNNKELLAENRRLYKENNKEQVAEYQREYKKQYIETPAGKKTGTMSSWRKNGVINVNDEMYERYIATTHCECCSKKFSSSRDRCLDHDHETGDFRWVICRACNNHDSWKNKI